MSEKLTQLYELCDEIRSEITDFDIKSALIRTRNFSLLGGNPDAKIMAIQMKPDQAEMNWSRRYVDPLTSALKNVSQVIFERTIDRAGFDYQKHIVRTNLFPFETCGNIMPAPELVDKFMWINDKVIKIIQPKVVLLLGQSVFNAMTKWDLSYPHYKSLLVKAETFESEGMVVIPVEDLQLIESKNPKQNAEFYELFRRLYVRTHELQI